VGEAKEQMQCILANAQLRAVQYSSSEMLTYVAGRREAQLVGASLEAANAALPTPNVPGTATPPPAPPRADTPGKGKLMPPSQGGRGGASGGGGSGQLNPLKVAFQYRRHVHC
jgi:hypothetical protein